MSYSDFSISDYSDISVRPNSKEEEDMISSFLSKQKPSITFKASDESFSASSSEIAYRFDSFDKENHSTFIDANSILVNNVETLYDATKRVLKQRDRRVKRALKLYYLAI